LQELKYHINIIPATVETSVVKTPLCFWQCSHSTCKYHRQSRAEVTKSVLRGL